jgi:hypothetical protein
MGKIQNTLDKFNELLNIPDVKNEKEADAAAKKAGIKWDKKKHTKDGDIIYLLKGKEVATYDDSFNALVAFGGKLT